MESHSRPPLPTSPEGLRVARRAQSDASFLPIGPHSSPTLAVGDIYYVIFRQKWKIIICSLIGFIAAVTYYRFNSQPYQSTARLFIRYVMESQGISASGEEEIRTKSLNERGDTILASEIAILTSLDLSKQVAEAIGPEKILAEEGEPITVNHAAGVIRSGLDVQITPRSSVINVVFSNRNPLIVQPVLTEVIDRYLKRHVEIHRGTGIVDGFLANQTEHLRRRLADTEDELRKVLNKAGVISLVDSKKAYADQIAQIKKDIFAAEADLAERSSLFEQLGGVTVKTPDADNLAAKSNTTEPSPDQLRQYQGLLNRIDTLQKREMELLSYFREDNVRVQDLRSQLAELVNQRAILEETYPRLVRLPAPNLPALTSPSTGSTDAATEGARLTALKVKIKQLNAQLQSVKEEAARTDELEISIMQLVRQKELEETNYRNYSRSLEQARINEAVGSGSVSNISQIQTPSPPFSDPTPALKITAGLALAGLVLGLAWAFVIEMFFDRSVRRPIDVERMLRLPLFLSIPKLSRKELDYKNTKPAIIQPQLLDGTGGGAKTNTTELAPWDSEHALHPFHETLRDRLMGYFESKGLTHKPKLVAVTGLGHNSGVTTTAAGLASSLSETGDGNVLLVDMTQGQGSAQQFYKGKAVCGIEEVLGARDNAQIENNLFVVGQEPGGERLSKILPHRFNQLVPKLKASNFDYIIFDMPPVSQISITPRLAGFMDMVLLVLESEKADRDLVQRATALLAESKAHVGAVLNKTQTYVPTSLHQDNLGNG